MLLVTKQLRKCSEDVTASSTKEGPQNKPDNDTFNSNSIFVEFFGPGVNQFSIADRSAVANLCTEYGAHVGYFPVDESTIRYLEHTGRDCHEISIIELYMKKVKMFRSSGEAESTVEYDQVINIDLSNAHVTISGPRKAKERIPIDEVPKNVAQSVAKLCNVPTNDRLGASLNIEIGMIIKIFSFMSANIYVFNALPI